MLGRKERLQIAQRASGILRESGALERIKHEGYTRIDPFKIATDADLVVMKRQLQDLLGGFVRDSQSGILVNIDRPPGMVHMTCAHELGHYFLGHETTVDQVLDYGPRGETKEREPEQTLSDVWVLDENDRDQVLEPRPQDRFIIDLPNHTSAGYLWSLDEVVDAGFKLRPLTEEIEPVRSPSGEFLEIERARLSADVPLVVGGRGRQRYVLEHGLIEELNFPSEPFDLEFKEAQPWRGDASHKDIFKLTTEFESMALGLDKRSQERLIAEVADE